MRPQLPPTSFVGTRAARVDLARQRFFDEGLLPTGVVTEAVFQSWSRCLRLHHRPGERAVFEPVTASRAHLALQKNRMLLQAWLEIAPKLEAVLGTTSCAAMLTDPTGVIIGASCAGRAHEELMPVATRVGVNLSEEAVGTTAPGVVARTGKAVTVLGADHFFNSVKGMHCAAAPIRDVRGHLAGVLDLSSETLPFSFDAAAVTGLYAGAIENRLLVAQSTDHLVVRFQIAEELLDTAMVGFVGIAASGGLAWQNGVARSLLGSTGLEEAARSDVEGSLGSTVSRLASLPAVGAALLTLPNGLLVWARAEMRSPDGPRQLFPGMRLDASSVPATPPASTPAPVAGSAEAMFGAGVHGEPPTSSAAAGEALPSASCDVAGAGRVSSDGMPPNASPSTLRESDLELIARTLRDCGGNVSEAARLLGVSRNLIYRRLRNLRAEPESEAL